MKSIINNMVKIMATGFVVLTFLSLLLFWVRFACETSLASRMPEEAKGISVRPSGLVPPKIEHDPNVVQHSYILASINRGQPPLLGIVEYLAARQPVPGGERNGDICFIESGQDWTYFDRRQGQIVCHYTRKERMPDKTALPRKVQLYAGPEGVSETADKALGRFISPIIDPRRMDPLTLYDQKLRRFFKINFNDKTIVKGPELAKDNLHRPIQIGRIRKIRPRIELHWMGPLIKVPEELIKTPEELIKTLERDQAELLYLGNDTMTTLRVSYIEDAGQYLLVLDQTGRIDLLDRETLEFTRTAGRLCPPPSLFPSKKSVTPKDLLAYEVLPLAFDNNREYKGMFAASVCRERTAMSLGVFDEQGKQNAIWYTRFTTEYREIAPLKPLPLWREYPPAPPRGYEPGPSEFTPSRHIPSSKAFFFGVPWAPALTTGKYLAESLHPPILSLVSYFTAYSFEAGAGHRALFILPNSFVAMKGRDVRQDAISRLGYALLLMLPSLILGIFLAWQIEKDGTVVGLSGNARLCWMIGTIVFGLAGYITYRLTRPKETLVTCTNCGKLRRPDMDRCHRCGSKWQVPQITPPAWRVIDSV